MKYSACLYKSDEDTLETAEENMLSRSQEVNHIRSYYCYCTCSLLRSLFAGLMCYDGCRFV